MDKSGRNVLSVNTGSNNIYVYFIDSGYSKTNTKLFKLHLGCSEGPIQLKFHPFLNIVYAVAKCANKIITLKFND